MAKALALLDTKSTVRRPAFRTGRLETWEAKSADGMWTFERLDDEGTPWIAMHACGIDVRTYFGTLHSARRSVASGLALRDIEAQAVSCLLTGKRYGR